MVEDVEDTPVVASDETETVAVEDAPAVAEDEPTVESSSDAAVEEVTQNGSSKAEDEVVEKPAEEAGKMISRCAHQFAQLTTTVLRISEESAKRKVDSEEASEVPEKRAKTDDVEAVEPSAEEATA